MRNIVLSAALLLLICCAKQPAESIAENNEALLYTSPHFVIHYTALDRANIAAIAQHLETNHERLARDFAAATLPVFTIYFYSDQQQFHNDINLPNAPEWVIGIATGARELRMMSPNWPSRNFDYMLTVAVHEFAHCVTLNLAPRIANNPRWLWEAVAIYASGQFVAPRNLAYMTSGTPPTLAELETSWQTNTKIYDLGYVLAEYIVVKWGMPALVSLIKNLGDIPTTLGVSVQEFESGWYAFVKNKYLG